MIGGLSVAIVLDSFQGAIIPALVFSCMAPWIHLVSALSGNVAVVTSTVMVRGLATGDLAESRIREAVVRELLIAVLIALILALAVGVAFSVYVEHFAGDWPSGTAEPQRALYALGCAMLASLAWAGLVGGLVPVICQLSRVIDPAIASGPFVTITCDISASAIFLFFIHRFLVA
jgi:magnesium transporter